MTLFKLPGRLLSTSTLVVLCALSVFAVAQQHNDAQAGSETAETEPKPAPKTSTSTATKTQDSFTPSEEVSEDLSVSFPVDI